MFVVNIVEHTSILLIPGGRELALAKAAFLELDDIATDTAYLREAHPGIEAPGSTIKAEETALQLPDGWVSRKAQFVPAFFKAIESGFSYDAKGPVSLDTEADSKYSATDNQNVLQAIANSKLGIYQDSGEQTEPADDSIALQEDHEELEYLAREEALIALMDGNLYDDNGRIRRAYNT